MLCTGIQPENEDVCRFCNKCLSSWSIERRLLHIESCSERVIRRVRICPNCSKKLNRNNAKSHLITCSSVIGTTLTDILLFCEQQNPPKPRNKNKRLPDKDLSTAIALSRSIVKSVKTANKKRVKATVCSSEHLLIDNITRFQIFSDRLSSILKTSSGRQSISSKEPVSSREQFLWNLSSSKPTNSPPNLNYYVSKLIPPLSPCKNKIGENLRNLSQIPGRSHSFQILEPTQIRPTHSPLASVKSNCFNQKFELSMETPTTPIKHSDSILHIKDGSIIQTDILVSAPKSTQTRSFSSDYSSTPFAQHLPLLTPSVIDTDIISTTSHNVVVENPIFLSDLFVRMVANPVCSDLSINLDSGDSVPAHRFVLAAWNPNLIILQEDAISAPGISKMQLLNLLTALYSADQKALSSLDPEVEFILDCWQLLDCIRPCLRTNSLPSKVRTISPYKDGNSTHHTSEEEKQCANGSTPQDSAITSDNKESSSKLSSEPHTPSVASICFSSSAVGGIYSADLFADTSSILIPETPCPKLPTIQCPISENIAVQSQSGSRETCLANTFPEVIEMDDTDDIPAIISTVNKSSHFSVEDKINTVQSQNFSLEASLHNVLPDEVEDISMSPFPDFDRMPSPPLGDEFVFAVNYSPVPLAKRLRLSDHDLEEPVLQASCSFPVSPFVSGTSAILRSPICMNAPTHKRSNPFSSQRNSSSQPMSSKYVHSSSYLDPDDVHERIDSDEEINGDEDLPRSPLSAPASPLQRSSSFAMSQMVDAEDGDEAETASSQPVFITPTARRLSTKVSINSPITPKPAYEHMMLADLQKCLSVYGVRNLSKKKAVILLNHIYDELHPYVEVPTPIRQPQRTIITSSSSTVLDRPSVPISSLPKFGDDESEGTSEKDSSTGQSFMDKNQRKDKEKKIQDAELHQKVYKYLHGDDNIYYNIATYTPIDLDCIHALLKDANIKVGQKRLMTWLDDWGVTFTTKNRNPTKPKQISLTGF